MGAPPLLFEDEIVQITEFKRHAKAYAEKARRRPITIAQGSVADLTLASREMFRRIFRIQRHLAEAVELLQHQLHGHALEEMSWASRLDDDDKAEFISEFFDALAKAQDQDTAAAWDLVQETLEDWKATVEALDNDELQSALERRQEVVA